MNLAQLPRWQEAPERDDLECRIHDLMALHWQHGLPLQLPLGGQFFDIVVTASGPEAYAVVTLMDQIQHTGDERADACGPVIEDPERSWLVWLVPPGTAEKWAPHRYALCLGRPYVVSLPALTLTEPPGPFWRRPCRGDRLVPPGPLWDLLARLQPGPTPHEALLGSALAAFS